MAGLRDIAMGIILACGIAIVSYQGNTKATHRPRPLFEFPSNTAHLAKGLRIVLYDWKVHEACQGGTVICVTHIWNSGEKRCGS